MDAITDVLRERDGFPRPAVAALKLTVFLAVMTAVLLGVPALVGMALFSLAS